MTGSKRCIFLTGAPVAEHLSWDEQRLLLDFEDPARRFLGTKSSITTENSLSTPTPTRALARWRSVAYGESTSRPTNAKSSITRNISNSSKPNSNAPRRLSDDDFLEHSIAILEDLDTSQIIYTTADHDDEADLQATTSISFATTATSTTTTSDSTSIFLTPTEASANIEPSPVLSRVPGGITDLRRIPDALHIERIRPQTMTVNLLVGIIHISPPRTVRLRRRNDVEMELVEVTVGDDTRAGLSITFWLVPETSQLPDPSRELRNTLNQLRSGQVVLLRNVALSCWKGNVYGQSLNQRFAKNRTSVSVIGNEFGIGIVTPGVESKLQRVRGWVADFVGVGVSSSHISFNAGKKEKGTRKRRGLDELPPDTPG